MSKVGDNESARSAPSEEAAADALRQSEERFRRIFEYSNDAIFLIEPENDRILDANGQAGRMLGYSREELRALPISAIHPDEMQQLRAFTGSIFEEGHGWTDELTCLTKNGEPLAAEISASIVEYAGTTCICVSVRDVSERRRVEEKLRQTDERVRLLLDSTGEGIYGIDLNGDCTFANPACVKLLGFKSADELLGRNMHSLIHHTRPNGDQYPNEQCRIYQAFRENRGIHVDDEVMFCSDGSSFPAEYWSYPVERDGELMGCVVTFVDISERRGVEQQLADQAAALAEVARFPEMNPGPVLRVDLEGTVLMANTAAGGVFGDELVGGCWPEICPGIDDTTWRGILEATGAVALEAQIGDWEFVFTYRRDFESNLVFVFGADVTEQKQAERLKRQLELENANLREEVRQFGSYQLVELLGRGGMGEVWVARHHMLARPAAIKLIRSEILGSGAESPSTVVRRFEREAQATAVLHSHHTVEVYDFGTSRDGAFYYVMELLQGLDLGALVERFGPISASRTVYLLRQVCHSLGEAHEGGLIHRDIKPANIFLCHHGPDFDFVKVLDFGLVGLRDDLGSQGTDLTAVGVAVGTPDFFSPELARGQAEIDGRVDIYALGCVGYWLLTGQKVFEGDTPLEVIVHHVRTEPVPPSKITEAEIPRGLEQVILSCLEKDAADRPQSAWELDELLSRSVPDDAWSAEKAKEWWTLHQPELVSTRLDSERLSASPQSLLIKSWQSD